MVFIILNWEKSAIQVSVHNVRAMSVFLDYGVPQGSVLAAGPSVVAALHLRSCGVGS